MQEVEVEVVAEATNVGSDQWMQKEIVFISIGKENVLVRQKVK